MKSDDSPALAVSFAMVAVVFGACPAVSGCSSPGSGDGSGTATPKPTAAATAASSSTPLVERRPGGNAEHRPQSARLKEGGLEQFMFFYGDIQGGVLTSTLGGGKIKGALMSNPAETAEVRFQHRRDDPCSRAENKTLIKLPLYRLTDDAGMNYCGQQVLTVASPDELYRCTKTPEQNAVTLREGLANFNSVHELAVAVPGYWDSEGKHHDTYPEGGAKVVTIGCITGVVAKCAHWGYVPGQGFGEKVKDLAGHHKACVRAARAEYVPGKSYTCSFTEVDIFDGIGIQDAGAHDGLDLESLWGEEKVLCREHARYGACKFRDASPCASVANPLITVWSRRDLQTPGAGECPDTDNGSRLCYR